MNEIPTVIAAPAFPEGARVRIGQCEGTVKGMHVRVKVQFPGVAGPGYFDPKFVHLVDESVPVADADLRDRVADQIAQHRHWHPGSCECGTWEADRQWDVPWERQWRLHVAESIVDFEVAPVLAERDEEIARLREIEAKWNDGLCGAMDVLREERDALRRQVEILGNSLQRTAYTEKDVASRDAEIDRLTEEVKSWMAQTIRADGEVHQAREELNRVYRILGEARLREMGIEPPRDEEDPLVPVGPELAAKMLGATPRSEATPTEPHAWTEFKSGDHATGTDLDGRTVTGRITGFFAWDNSLGRNSRAYMDLDAGVQTVVHSPSLRSVEDQTGGEP